MQTHTRRARWKKTERKKCVIKATASTGCKVAAGGLHKSTAKGSRLRWWRSFAVGKSASSCVPDTGDATVTPSFAELEKLRDSPWGKCTRLSFFVMTGEAEKKITLDILSGVMKVSQKRDWPIDTSRQRDIALQGVCNLPLLQARVYISCNIFFERLLVPFFLDKPAGVRSVKTRKTPLMPHLVYRLNRKKEAS